MGSIHELPIIRTRGQGGGAVPWILPEFLKSVLQGRVARNIATHDAFHDPTDNRRVSSMRTAAIAPDSAV